LGSCRLDRLEKRGEVEEEELAKVANRAVAVARISDRINAIIDDTVIDRLVAESGVAPNTPEDWLLIAEAMDRSSAWLRELASK
jgi:hypothetical protein